MPKRQFCEFGSAIKVRAELGFRFIRIRAMYGHQLDNDATFLAWISP
jgi:hypothetical protein